VLPPGKHNGVSVYAVSANGKRLWSDATRWARHGRLCRWRRRWRQSLERTHDDLGTRHRWWQWHPVIVRHRPKKLLDNICDDCTWRCMGITYNTRRFTTGPAQDAMNGTTAISQSKSRTNLVLLFFTYALLQHDIYSSSSSW